MGQGHVPAPYSKGTGTPIYSIGIDWSGDAGHPDKSGSSPFLVIAAVRLDQNQLAILSETLVKVRSTHRYSDQSCYRFSSAARATRSDFFKAVAEIEFDCWVRTVDKRGEWHRSFVPSLSGEQRLVTHVLEILGSMPAGEEERTAVLLDIPRSENRRVQQWRKQMRDHNALAGRSSFGKVKSQEDTATGGEIIQLADMLAGAVNHQLQGDNATLGMLSGRIQLV